MNLPIKCGIYKTNLKHNSKRAIGSVRFWPYYKTIRFGKLVFWFSMPFRKFNPHRRY